MIEVPTTRVSLLCSELADLVRQQCLGRVHRDLRARSLRLRSPPGVPGRRRRRHDPRCPSFRGRHERDSRYDPRRGSFRSWLFTVGAHQAAQPLGFARAGRRPQPNGDTDTNFRMNESSLPTTMAGSRLPNGIALLNSIYSTWPPAMCERSQRHRMRQAFWQTAVAGKAPRAWPKIWE